MLCSQCVDVALARDDACLDAAQLTSDLSALELRAGCSWLCRCRGWLALANPALAKPVAPEFWKAATTGWATSARWSTRRWTHAAHRAVRLGGKGGRSKREDPGRVAGNETTRWRSRRRSQPAAAARRLGVVRWVTLLAVVAIILLGALAGLGIFTFGYGQGASYLSSDPSACANCHVMQGHFDSWQRSSHQHVAVCNDCHLPHNFVGKWITKADNGFFHSLAFTLENYRDPIQIKPRNRRVAQRACLHCHADMVHEMLPLDAHGEMPSCVHCHSSVGHALR